MFAFNLAKFPSFWVLTLCPRFAYGMCSRYTFNGYCLTMVFQKKKLYYYIYKLGPYIQMKCTKVLNLAAVCAIIDTLYGAIYLIQASGRKIWGGSSKKSFI